VVFYVGKIVYGSQLNQSEDSRKRPQPTEDSVLNQENANGDQLKKKRKSKKHVNKAVAE
jgi:RNA exonuclease 1